MPRPARAFMAEAFEVERRMLLTAGTASTTARPSAGGSTVRPSRGALRA